MDSLGVVGLLAFIHEEFGVEVPDEALVPERFETIEDIARVVHGLVDARVDRGLVDAPPGSLRRGSSRDSSLDSRRAAG